jgi:hypothetical protein
MRNAVKNVACVLGVTVFTGAIALVPQAAHAVPTTPVGTPADSVGTLGGCREDQWYRCGKIANHSDISVWVTTNWGTSNDDRWDSARRLKPGHSAGGYGTDIDGFHVGDCGLFTELGYLPANTGWVKIPNYTALDIWGSWC